MKNQYIIKFLGGPYDGLYYSSGHAWQGVDKQTAERFDHKTARKIQGHLKRRGIEQATSVELVK